MISKPVGVSGTEQSSTAKFTRGHAKKFVCQPFDDTLTDLSKLREQGSRAILCGGSLGNWMDDCWFPNL